MPATFQIGRYYFELGANYFRDIDNPASWDSLDSATSCSFNPESSTLVVQFKNSFGNTCALLIRVIGQDTVRVRFNPTRASEQDYPDANTRLVVMDTMTALVGTMPAFSVDPPDTKTDPVIVLVRDSAGTPTMKLVVGLRPFSVSIRRFDGTREIPLVSDAGHAVRYRQIIADGGKDTDYSIVQCRNKPSTSAYFGFGEKGGRSFCKNGRQLTYFGYDNMRYMQVYGQGPLDDREPLYDSNPLFFETNAVANDSAVSATLVDNPSESFVDVGVFDSGRLMFGSMFADLDYYVFIGDDLAGVLGSITSVVGKGRLKPRYALGYHQGCYGYDTADKCLGVARAYGDNQFPLDGLHIDVDIQNDYRTFTIDTNKFPNAGAMFQTLRGQGIRSSTNITPIISDKDPEYPVYQDGLAKGCFVPDQRRLSHPGTPPEEWHQNFGGGQQYWWSNQNSRINSGLPYQGEVYYGNNPDGSPRGTSGVYPDFGQKAVRWWWGEQYRSLFETGLEMVWQDMTNPCIRETRGDMKSFPHDLLLTNDFVVHSDDDDASSPWSYPKDPAVKQISLYPYNLHKATYHGLNNLTCRNGLRNFIIGRGAYTGAHRFAALWTGDNASTWDFLRINVPQVLGIGLSGQHVAGADIGGFEAGQDWEHWAAPDLIIRWMLAGSLLPWFRNHYIAKGRKHFQEPYMYQTVVSQVPLDQVWLYQAVLPVTRHYVRLRYRLLQLLYDAMFEGTQTGVPIVRPLMLNDGQDKALYSEPWRSFMDTEYFVGRDLLVAPVLDPESVGHGHREIYLPAGSDWYCFMDNAVPLAAATKGAQIIPYEAYISTDPGHIRFILPIYVRAGAIIPTVEYATDWYHVGDEQTITLNVYPGAAGSYDMYLDDGTSRASAPAKKQEEGGDPLAAGKYRQTHIEHRYVGGTPLTREVSVVRLYDEYTPAQAYFFVAILHEPGEPFGPTGPQGSPLASVQVSGSEARLMVSGDVPARRQAAISASGPAWYFDEAAGVSYIKIMDAASQIAVRAQYKKSA